MGAERAVTAVTPGTQAVPLSGFNDVILATIKLVDKGHWILTGRVLLFNVDGDSQFASAKLVHDGNMVDVLSTRIRSFDRAAYMSRPELSTTAAEPSPLNATPLTVTPFPARLSRSRSTTSTSSRSLLQSHAQRLGLRRRRPARHSSSRPMRVQCRQVVALAVRHGLEA